MLPVLAPSDAADDAAASRGIRTFHYGEFGAPEIAEAARERGASIHVVIPARDEEDTIGAIAATVRRELMEAVPLVDELVVVDDGSADRTGVVAREAGARVVRGPGLGKGEAMAFGVGALVVPTHGNVRERIIVFLDGDVRGFGASFVTGLVGPLLCGQTEDERLDVQLVKGRYRRPLRDQPGGGGRVTELVAKPALRLFFPELAALGQPLAGETAVRASLLDDVELEGGYAVEVAMIIDTYLAHGLAAIAEVDLGERRHRNRDLAELVPEAETVLRTVFERAVVDGATVRRAVRSEP